MVGYRGKEKLLSKRKRDYIIRKAKKRLENPRVSGFGFRIPYAPPKILGSIATENFYLLSLHSSLFTGNAPENFEGRSNSEKVRSAL